MARRNRKDICKVPCALTESGRANDCQGRLSSTNFTWMKVGGVTYNNENSGGNSTFTIPASASHAYRHKCRDYGHGTSCTRLHSYLQLFGELPEGRGRRKLVLRQQLIGQPATGGSRTANRGTPQTDGNSQDDPADETGQDADGADQDAVTAAPLP